MEKTRKISVKDKTITEINQAILSDRTTDIFVIDINGGELDGSWIATAVISKELGKKVCFSNYSCVCSRAQPYFQKEHLCPDGKEYKC